ncbi:MAG: 4-diphosphocytidyl-2C-methyl-D-erythritol kinase, partial [bacterium]
DIPLATAKMVEDFINACRETEADVYYSMVERSLNEKKYPGMKRTYIKLREGTYTGGNVVLLNPEVLRKQWGTIEQAMALRKSPLKLLGMMGFVFILKFLFKKLSRDEIEKKAGSILGFRVKAVEVADPEIGIDVDKESDYLLVKEKLGL